MSNRPSQFPSRDSARAAGVAAYRAAKLQQPWKVVVKEYGAKVGQPFYEWRLVYMTGTHKFSCEQYDDGHWLVMADHVVHDLGTDHEESAYASRAATLRDALGLVLAELREVARKHSAISEACERALHRMRRGRSRDQG